MNLIDVLPRTAPDSADEDDGSGREQAAGGALRAGGWIASVVTPGGGSDVRVGA